MEVRASCSTRRFQNKEEGGGAELGVVLGGGTGSMMKMRAGNQREVREARSDRRAWQQKYKKKGTASRGWYTSYTCWHCGHVGCSAQRQTAAAA